MPSGNVSAVSPSIYGRRAATTIKVPLGANTVQRASLAIGETIFGTVGSAPPLPRILSTETGALVGGQMTEIKVYGANWCIDTRVSMRFLDERGGFYNWEGRSDASLVDRAKLVREISRLGFRKRTGQVMS